MKSGKERAAEILHGEEGDEMYLQLVRYAENLARMHGWRVDVLMPAASEPQSIVNEVLAKLLDQDGGRNWDERKEPSLLNALKGMVRSEIGHLFKKPEVTLLESISKPLMDGNERTADTFPSTVLRPDDPDPEQEVLRAERGRLGYAAMTIILREVKGDSELESVFLALCDTDDRSEIAARTGLSVGQVDSARKRLGRILNKVTRARVIAAAREESKR